MLVRLSCAFVFSLLPRRAACVCCVGSFAGFVRVFLFLLLLGVCSFVLRVGPFCAALAFMASGCLAWFLDLSVGVYYFIAAVEDGSISAAKGQAHEPISNQARLMMTDCFGWGAVCDQKITPQKRDILC